MSSKIYLKFINSANQLLVKYNVMKFKVYIRRLILADAQVSYKWRNNPEIWRYTEFKPNHQISLKIEEDWLKNKLNNKNEERFAICLASNDRYIGNIQLIDIDLEGASFHLFIGEKIFWGKGIAQQATKLILKYAFTELGLKQVALEVHKANLAAIAVYKKMGFIYTSSNNSTEFVKMICTENATLTNG
jgi:diamine N-acetyltransferase